MAEDASNLSEDFKKSITEIPWTGINSIRNRICHDYDVVDYGVLYKTIKKDFPLTRQILIDSINIEHINLDNELYKTIRSQQKAVIIKPINNKFEITKLILLINEETDENFIAEITDIKANVQCSDNNKLIEIELRVY